MEVKTNKVAESRKTLMPSDRSRFPFSEIPDHRPQKEQIFQPGDAFEDTAFKPWYEDVKL
jgi:hypothetical protein